jgi:hypothetical protein
MVAAGRPRSYKLGKRPARPGAIRLKLGAYLNAAALPPLPAVFGHQDLIAAWPMFANDRYGDCVFAGAAHETMLLNREAGRAVDFTDGNVLSDYTAVTGFNANNPSTDNGTDMQAAAAYRQKTGIIDARGDRHTVAAYLALAPGNVADLYCASYLFGAVGIGLELPVSALDQTATGAPWDVVVGAAVEGGHYVPLVGRRADGLLAVVSWGALQPMTEAFLARYCDEAVAYVSTECLVNQKSPEGFDYAQLTSDLAAL